MRPRRGPARPAVARLLAVLALGGGAARAAGAQAGPLPCGRRAPRGRPSAPVVVVRARHTVGFAREKSRIGSTPRASSYCKRRAFCAGP